MKTRAIVATIIISFLTGGIILPSCKKDKENDPGTPSKSLSVQFTKSYGLDYGWVVLHNPEGTEVVNYHKYEGDGYLNFGEVSAEFVTTTIIRIDTNMNAKGEIDWDIYIATDMLAPAGHWTFNGNNYYRNSVGTANVTLYYPNNDFNEYLISTSSGLYKYNEVPAGEVNKQINTYHLDDNNKCSVYGAVINDDGGLCNWTLDQNFQLYQTNDYTLQLDKILTNKYVVTSKPLHIFYAVGFWNDRNSMLRLFREYYSYYINPLGETSHKIYYPEQMPLSEVRFKGYYMDENIGYFYAKFYPDFGQIPQNISIPDHSITANYDENADRISNIQITGNADQISGVWHYFDLPAASTQISWAVYANHDFPMLNRPPLPQTVLDDIGSIVSKLEIESIGISDNNTTASHTDIITRFFIENVPINKRNDEYYAYTLYLNQKHRTQYHSKYIESRLTSDKFRH